MVTQSHFSEIFAELFKFREDGFMCDTVIIARDKKLDAHGLLLAAASPVFRSAFQMDDRPGQHFVNLSHVDSAIMEIALHFIYTGKLLLPHIYAQTNELPKLFASLHRLGLEPQKLNGCEMRFKSPEESSDYQLPKDNEDGECVVQDAIQSKVLEEFGESTLHAAAEVDHAVDEHGNFELDVLTELVNGNAVAKSLSPSMQSVVAETKEDEEFEEEMAERAAEVSPVATRKRRKAALASDQKRNSLMKNNVKTKGRRKWQIHLLSNKAKRANRFAVNDSNAKMVSLLTGMKYGRVKTEPLAQDSTDFEEDEVCLLQSNCVKEEIASEAAEMDNAQPRKYPDKQMLFFLISSKTSSDAIGRTQGLLQQSKPSKKHTCFVCNKVCKTRSKLEQHLLIHTGEKPHVCPYCNKGFANKSNLERHMKMHTGIRPHLCDLCGKGFIQKTSLLDHMLIHYEAKAYKCTACGLTYNRKTNLQQHFKRLHQSRPGHVTNEADVTGDDAKRPFLCDLCGRGFATVVTLKFHKKLHTGEKPFVCSICSKSFVQKTQLDQHFRIHTGVKPYICQTCGKAFVYKDSLTQHTRIHTGEKPYVCQICSKAYTQSHHLKGHMLTHTGEKPYACQLCSKSYKNRADLRFHSTRVHQVNLPKLSKNNF